MKRISICYGPPWKTSLQELKESRPIRIIAEQIISARRRAEMQTVFIGCRTAKNYPQDLPPLIKSLIGANLTDIIDRLLIDCVGWHSVDVKNIIFVSQLRILLFALISSAFSLERWSFENFYFSIFQSPVNDYFSPILYTKAISVQDTKYIKFIDTNIIYYY